MDNEFIDMSDMIYEIKDKIIDGEYMKIMEKLRKIREKYIEDVRGKYICKCEINSENFCSNNFESFITCKNNKYILSIFPILRNIIIFNSLPLTHNAQKHYYFRSNLQLEPINIDKEYTELEISKIVSTVYSLINLMTNINYKFPKIFISIAIYDYLFKYFGFCQKNTKFCVVIYEKLLEFYETEQRIVSDDLNIIKKIYSLKENPYKIFLNNMEKYYKIALEKELQKQQLANAEADIIAQAEVPVVVEPVNDALANDTVVAEQVNEEVNEPRTIHIARKKLRARNRIQQAEEDVNSETRYPLRNRIKNRNLIIRTNENIDI